MRMWTELCNKFLSLLLFQVTLLGAWKDIMEANADDTLKEWLTEYYDQLLSTWHAEVWFHSFKICKH